MPSSMNASPDMDPIDHHCFRDDEDDEDALESFSRLLWPSRPHGDTRNLRAYFKYFRSECRPRSRVAHAARTYRDLIRLRDIVRDKLDVPISELKKAASRELSSSHGHISASSQSSEKLSREDGELESRRVASSIELAVRLWLLVDVRNVMPAERSLLHSTIPWPDNLSFLEIMQGNRPPETEFDDDDRGGGDGGQFPAHLTLHNLRNLGGFEVCWTNNWMDHLRLEQSSIYIFHQVTVFDRLRDEAKSDDGKAVKELLPPALMDETLRTIGLLLPSHDGPSNRWLKGEIAARGLDGRLFDRREFASRDRMAYRYWCGRLAELEAAFDRAKPRNLFQWWKDRRDPAQWWGFWLVVTGVFLTVLFGLIQSVTGIIQVVHG